MAAKCLGFKSKLHKTFKGFYKKGGDRGLGNGSRIRQHRSLTLNIRSWG